ncbi:MAG: hypothetical protein AB7G75_34025 [Candidatus Binatia bacterium]
MAINENKVDQIIADTLSRHGGENSPNPDVRAAFTELYTKRNTDPSAVGDENLAAAEHHMLARYWVATGFVPIEQMVSQILVYNAAKKVAEQVPGLEYLMRHDPKKPTVPPSPIAVKKALEGAQKGEVQRIRNGVAKPPWNDAAFNGYSHAQKK